jgi:hypothetical protein
MKNKKSFLILFTSILLICLILLVVLVFDENSVYANTMESIDIITNQIDYEIDQMVKSNDKLAFSSNPHGIVQNSENYNNLVKLSVPAVKPLYDKIKNSNQSDLIEYIYALAIEDILNINVMYDFYGWKNSSEFLIAFREHQENTVKEYTELKLNNNFDEIKKLSIEVIPYLILDIENSYQNNDLKKALIDVLDSKLKIKVDMNNIDKWININKNKYMMLKII